MSREVDKLVIRPQPSLYLLLWLVLTTSAGLFAVWQLQGNLASRLILSLGVIGYFAWACHHHLFRRQSGAIIQATLKPEGHWQLLLGNGRQLRSALAQNCFVTPWMMILHFKTEGWFGASLLILKDSLEQDVSRRLRIRLSHQAFK